MKTYVENINHYEDKIAVRSKRNPLVIWILVFVSMIVFGAVAFPTLQGTFFVGCTSTSCVANRFYWTVPGTNYQICLPC